MSRIELFSHHLVETDLHDIAPRMTQLGLREISIDNQRYSIHPHPFNLALLAIAVAEVEKSPEAANKLKNYLNTHELEILVTATDAPGLSNFWAAGEFTSSKQNRETHKPRIRYREDVLNALFAYQQRSRYNNLVEVIPHELKHLTDFVLSPEEYAEKERITYEILNSLPAITVASGTIAFASLKDTPMTRRSFLSAGIGSIIGIGGVIATGIKYNFHDSSYGQIEQMMENKRIAELVVTSFSFTKIEA